MFDSLKHTITIELFGLCCSCFWVWYYTRGLEDGWCFDGGSVMVLVFMVVAVSSDSNAELAISEVTRDGKSRFVLIFLYCCWGC